MMSMGHFKDAFKFVPIVLREIGLLWVFFWRRHTDDSLTVRFQLFKQIDEIKVHGFSRFEDLDKYR